MGDGGVGRDLGGGEHFEKAGGVGQGAYDGESEDQGVEPGEPEAVEGVDVGLGHGVWFVSEFEQDRLG